MKILHEWVNKQSGKNYRVVKIFPGESNIPTFQVQTKMSGFKITPWVAVYIGKRLSDCKLYVWKNELIRPLEHMRETIRVGDTEIIINKASINGKFLVTTYERESGITVQSKGFDSYMDATSYRALLIDKIAYERTCKW